MQVKKLSIEGLLAIYPDQSSDENGRYSYYFDSKKFREAGVMPEFVQEHASCYALKGTVRGLHFQAPPKAQYKLVRVVKGRILDFCVDIRTDSLPMESTSQLSLLQIAGFNSLCHLGWRMAFAP